MVVSLIYYLLFAYAVGWLTAVFFDQVVLKQAYDEGKNVSTTHVWVIQGTNTPVHSATDREVHEHIHGRGSWERLQEQGFVTAKRGGGILPALFVGLVAFHPGLRWWMAIPGALLVLGLYLGWNHDAVLQRPKPPQSPFELPEGVRKFAENPVGEILTFLYFYVPAPIAIVSYLVALSQNRAPGEWFMVASALLLMLPIMALLSLPFLLVDALLNLPKKAQERRRKAFKESPVGKLVWRTTLSTSADEAFRELVAGGYLVPGAVLDGASLSERDLRGKDLSSISLNEGFLSNSHLENANLEQAHLHKAWLTEAHLSGANLSRADLREAHFSEADLSGADLRRADLRKADLWKANLTGARLDGANLSEASLWETRLDGASLKGTNLRKARVWGVKLDPPALSQARLDKKTRAALSH
ncbi:MAG: pentapeptide repeat-containing protein [Anaerolineae bacterium]|nr:pentapeptide repeat-containing protein [Anaerolineae bacterium]